MRVMVSSTCFDLLDVRAELEHHLRTMGFTPALSDSATSDFVTHPDRSSIETCLANVRTSDAIIFVLSQRYGGILRNDYGGISATHLEYKEARSHNIPMRFYVRDRLLGEIEAWKRADDAARAGLDLRFAGVENVRLLAAFLDEHSKLQDKQKNNWFDTFGSSTELKQLVSRDFKAQSSAVMLERLIENDRVPAFAFAVGRNANNPGWPVVNAFLFGSLAAINAEWKAGPPPATEQEDRDGWNSFVTALEPRGSQVVASMPSPTSASPQCMRLRYRTQHGHCIEDQISVERHPNQTPEWTARIERRRLLDRPYRIG